MSKASKASKRKSDASPPEQPPPAKLPDKPYTITVTLGPKLIEELATMTAIRMAIEGYGDFDRPGQFVGELVSCIRRGLQAASFELPDEKPAKAKHKGARK